MDYGQDAPISFDAAAVIKNLPQAEKRDPAGPYDTARAWLGYDTTNWAASDLAPEDQQVITDLQRARVAVP